MLRRCTNGPVADVITVSGVGSDVSAPKMR